MCCCFRLTGCRPRFDKQRGNENLNALDATCPLVTKVHLEAIKYAKKGFTIVLIGHDGHDEVVGTMGESAPHAIVLVEDEDDVDSLQIDDDTKLAYLTQTTLSVDDANRIIRRLARTFSEHPRPAEGRYLLRDAKPPGSCPRASQQADVLLCLAARTALTRSVFESWPRSKANDRNLVDGPQDLQADQFHDDDCVLITAGASAPESVVRETVDWLWKSSRHGRIPVDS